MKSRLAIWACAAIVAATVGTAGTAYADLVFDLRGYNATPSAETSILGQAINVAAGGTYSFDYWAGINSDALTDAGIQNLYMGFYGTPLGGTPLSTANLTLTNALSNYSNAGFWYNSGVITSGVGSAFHNERDVHRHWRRPNGRQYQHP